MTEEHRHDYRRCVACEDVLGQTLTSEERIEVIRSYARRYPHIRRFIETGTANGDTCAALVDEFDQLWTIELDAGCVDVARQRFANQSKVYCCQGESDKWLADLAVTGSMAPTVYWLDAHACGGARAEKATPVLEEVDAILSAGHKNVILVDDVRLFGTEPEWPPLSELTAKLIKEGYVIQITDDILRAVPA